MVTNELYQKLPNLVLGFHGCALDAYKDVIYNHNHLKPSKNLYDWLGNGIYFWENSYERAEEWAKSKYKEKAKVIGAVIDLGYCLNLTDYSSTKYLKAGYDILKELYKTSGKKIPENKKGEKGSKSDVLLRNLDCAVIETVHEYNRNNQWAEYDSVRGIFTEGRPIYPNAGIVEKTHVQICIRNPNCIKGYFNPLDKDDNYSIP